MKKLFVIAGTIVTLTAAYAQVKTTTTNTGNEASSNKTTTVDVGKVGGWTAGVGASTTVTNGKARTDGTPGYERDHTKRNSTSTTSPAATLTKSF